MSYPEIIFITQSNNPSPFLQKLRKLSKAFLNKSGKICQRNRLKSDSSAPDLQTLERRKARCSKGFVHLPVPVKTACSGTSVLKPENAETGQCFYVTGGQSAASRATATAPV